MAADQHLLWNDKHAAGVHAAHSDSVTAFANLVLPDIKPQTNLLDLGCGVAGDSRYFAEHGVQVTATDFSEVVIAQDKERIKLQGLQFAVVDLAKSLPYDAASFDSVYAHLSLHYFSDNQTQIIFDEIARILRPGGRLYFACKSTNDPKYGEGDRIAPDMFIVNGHIRHFFSPGYCRLLLEKSFHIDRLEESSSEYSGQMSAFVYCFATKAR
jgi:SAM-dependent methyltransferase